MEEDRAVINNSPLVSIVICTYNGERFLRQTLDSVLAQTYPNIEVIIVDDGSKDGTADVINEYANRHKKIKPYFKKNGGLPNARNFAFQKSQGDWLAIIDQDDLCYPNRIARQLEVSKEYPTAGLIFCDTHFIDEHGNILGHHFSKFSLPDAFIPKVVAGNLLLQVGCYVDSEAWFMRRDVFEKVGLLDEKLSYACDFEYFIRVGMIVDFAYAREILAAWRVHSSQATATAPKIRQQVRGVYLQFFWSEAVGWWTKALIIKALARSYAGQLRDRLLGRVK
ncbi:glycosyltransferase [Rhodoferax saidenbachensis]|uniref:Glycosyltransferase 2-like domain-containing protein n=1 Tax=Rhodoferax saidenbachensis TaxID=1484693 RepID=A0A1P8KDR6_9BURK|nr:glycosyltransferase [Rhodoferax saidenbachensis]APW44171.1 hypothetical protein RS694_17650 [Rhodoferax saidenbachensis]